MCDLVDHKDVLIFQKYQRGGVDFCLELLGQRAFHWRCENKLLQYVVKMPYYYSAKNSHYYSIQMNKQKQQAQCSCGVVYTTERNSVYRCDCILRHNFVKFVHLIIFSLNKIASKQRKYTFVINNYGNCNFKLVYFIIKKQPLFYLVRVLLSVNF